MRPIPIDPLDRKGGHGGEGWAEIKAGYQGLIEKLEGAVAADQPRRAIRVLREVAGKGRCVSHFSKGAARALNTAALVRAADVVAAFYHLEHPRDRAELRVPRGYVRHSGGCACTKVWEDEKGGRWCKAVVGPLA